MTAENAAQLPGRGETAPLKYTETGNQRVLVGLSWDPQEKPHGVLNAIRSKVMNEPWFMISRRTGPEEDSALNQNYDLDLSCYAFDADGNFKSLVSPDDDRQIDESKSIYHTGDDLDGGGGHDDEIVYLELRDMPDDVASLFFIISSKNRFTFDDISGPECRIADSTTEQNLLHHALGDEDGSDKNAFIFARIFRDGDKWMVHNISTYTNADTDEDFRLALSEYL